MLVSPSYPFRKKKKKKRDERKKKKHVQYVCHHSYTSTMDLKTISDRQVQLFKSEPGINPARLIHKN